MVFATILSTLSEWRTSTCTAVAEPPVELISRATVVIVDSGEFGLGLSGMGLEGSLMVLAATTTVKIHESGFLRNEMNT